jgi:hypothetical protein
MRKRTFTKVDSIELAQVNPMGSREIVEGKRILLVIHKAFNKGFLE